MPVGLSVARANTILGTLDAIGLYLKLHTGDPGAAGTANPATETTRQLCDFGTPSGGVMANVAVIDWTGIASSQDATHFSAWSASTGGNFEFSGLITAAAYVAGDIYRIQIGGATVGFGVAS